MPGETSKPGAAAYCCGSCQRARGEDLHDLSITGTGLIYGKGLSFGADGANPAPRGGYPIYVANHPGVGNKAIALKNCHNVRDLRIGWSRAAAAAILPTADNKML